MKALTIHRPWTDAIAYLPEPYAKRVENRTWAPPRYMDGAYLAIHAGKTYDREGADWIRELLEVEGCAWPVPTAEESPTGIVAVARLRGAIQPDDDGNPVGAEVDDSHEIWWTGGVGWVLESVVPIPPVPVKGRQGLWNVPAELMPALRLRTRAAAMGRLDPRPRYLRTRERAEELAALTPEAWAKRVHRAGVRIETTPAELARREVGWEIDRELRTLARHESAQAGAGG